jgi:multidrug efflux pump subunit AcrA (membrane-fusion protein)
MIAIPEAKDLQIIEKKTTDVVLVAGQMVIDSQAKYDDCANFLKIIKGLRQEIDQTFDQNIKDAHTLHKNLVATKKIHSDPLDRAETIVKSKSITFIREQEQIAAEAARKAAEIARIAEDKRKAELEAQAKAWEAKGNAAKAEERREAAAAVFVPVPEVEPTFQRATGQSIKKTWKCEVISVLELCKAIANGTLPETMVAPNMTALNALARTMEDKKQYPGLKFYAEDSMSVRR